VTLRMSRERPPREVEEEEEGAGGS